MSNPEQYVPGPSGEAAVRKDGETVTLVLVRGPRHRPERIWPALTVRALAKQALLDRLQDHLDGRAAPLEKATS